MNDDVRRESASSPSHVDQPDQIAAHQGLCCFSGLFEQPDVAIGALVLCGCVLVVGEGEEEYVQSFVLSDEFGPLHRHELHVGLDERPAPRGRRRPRSSFLAVFKPEEGSRGLRPFSRQLTVRQQGGDATMRATLAVCQLSAVVEAPEWAALRRGAPLLADRLIANILLAEPESLDQERFVLSVEDFVRAEAALVVAVQSEGLDPSRLYAVSGHGVHAAPCAEPTESPQRIAGNPVSPGRRHRLIASLGMEPFETEAFFIELGNAEGRPRMFGPVAGGAVEEVDRAVSLVLDGLPSPFLVPPSRAERLFRPLVTPPRRPVRTRRFDYGPRDGTPLCSLVIPFYGDAFYLTSVLDLQRILDSRFEIVLVVDDPRLWAPISRALDSRRASLRLKTVLLLNSHNAGYAAATNIGARAATGAVLFLMNSDVYVQEPDALLAAAEEIDRRSRAGEKDLIAGFSLLYEDHSIQHVGIDVVRQATLHDLYLAEHPMKGMPSQLYESGPARGVEAVTGALLGISRIFYAALGGLDEVYVRGDFEDVDLCLRAAARGAEIKVFSSRSLFHFERQAVRHIGIEPYRHMITYVNALTFNQRWAGARDARKPRQIRVRRRTLPLATEGMDGGSACS